MDTQDSSDRSLSRCDEAADEHGTPAVDSKSPFPEANPLPTAHPALAESPSQRRSVGRVSIAPGDPNSQHPALSRSRMSLMPQLTPTPRWNGSPVLEGKDTDALLEDEEDLALHSTHRPGVGSGAPCPSRAAASAAQCSRACGVSHQRRD